MGDGRFDSAAWHRAMTLKHSVSEHMSRQQPEKHLNETIDSCAAGCHNLSFNEKKSAMFYDYQNSPVFSVCEQKDH